MVGVWQKFRGVAELCITPKSIFSPIPYFAIFLFLLSIDISNFDFLQLWLFAAGIILTLVAVSASNIWNHVNDLKEDVAAGKKTLLTRGQVGKRNIVFFSTFLYATSIVISVYLSSVLDRMIFPPFVVWAIITWLYSDGIFFIHLTKIRLKTHYAGELLTYTIAYPTFTLSIWLIYSDSLIQGIILSTAFLFFGISGVLLKDLRDISGDRKAGLKTFGVIFEPSKLLHLSCILLILYYLTLLTTTIIGLFHIGALLIFLPFAYFIHGTFLHFTRKHWEISEEDHQPINIMMTTTYASLLFFAVGNLLPI